MTTPDYCEVTWSPTRAAAIVRMTVDEIPYDECDEAAHQLLACGNLARRINTPPAKRVDVTDLGSPDPVTLPTEVDARTDDECLYCDHRRDTHDGPLSSKGYRPCTVTGCSCNGFTDP